MKATTSYAIPMALFAVSPPHAHGQSEVILKQVLEPGVSKTYGHQSSIVLADGFWAKAGSDVTAIIIVDGLLQMVEFVPPPGYRTPVETYSGSHSDDSVSVGRRQKRRPAKSDELLCGRWDRRPGGRRSAMRHLTLGTDG